VTTPPYLVEESGESITGRAPDVSVKILRALRNGELPIQARLDLHGRLRDEALCGVERFVGAARARGAKIALVIHGRGHNSEAGTAVLRPAVWQWLASPAAARAGVMAFASARPRDGGAGATVILLRRT
jgi:DNA-nicking Smr family endonuclease